MRYATAWSRSLGILITLAGVGVLGEACDSSDDPSLGDDTGTGADGCVPDPSTGPATAIATSTGQKQTEAICPRGDRDWYVFDVPPGSNLLDVSASYPGSITKIKLFARLYAADGVTPVANGEIDDAAPATGTTSLSSTLRVAQPGRYYLEVGDIQDADADPRNSYVLQVAFAADPDTHEPNDTAATAKPPDTAPGFLSYRGDIDMFRVTTTDPSALLHLTLNNPAAAKSAIDYQVTASDGTVLSKGTAPPAAAPLDTLRALRGAGDYFIALSYPATSLPDRRPEAGYTLALGFAPEPDANEIPVRNDTPLTPTCPGGGAGPCTTAFSGTKVDLPAQTGFIASLGDRDVFRVDATTAPAVLEADLSAGSTPMQLALTFLTPHAASPCTKDSECAAINVPCKVDTDCELSHKCLNDDNYTFCKTPPCRLCEGSGACVPTGAASGPRVCAATQYTTWDTDGGTQLDKTGKNRIRTAQPMFTTGPMYVVVHDFQDKRYDTALKYDLALHIAPEPDPNDQSTTAAQRNNFYNPYPLQDSDLKPSRARAKDITAAITAGTAVTGFISYQSDEDWYVFDHPCGGQECGLRFEWVQPASAVLPIFMMRSSGLGLHESWTYKGTADTSTMGGPLTEIFGDGDCHECSYAAGGGGKYYIQVRDFGSAHFDYSSGGRYSFRLASSTLGCPAQCSLAPPGYPCGEWCGP